jgi:hypothetical protein
MALKLNRSENESYWIEVGGGRFRVCPTSLSEDNNMRQRYTRIKRGVEVVDSTALLKARFRRVVTGWEDVEVNGNKKPECTAENKNYVVEWFTDIAMEVLTQANDIREETEKVEDKNLKK